MKCPACQVDLVMSERQSIEIDYCAKCRGVWLDRGELDEIIEKCATEMAPTLQPRSAELRYQEPPRNPEPRHQESQPQRGYYHGYKKPYRRKLTDPHAKESSRAKKRAPKGGAHVRVRSIVGWTYLYLRDPRRPA
jgi:Zn-finger nucleic acid-binding protein